MPQAITSRFRRLLEAMRGFSLAQRTIALIGVAVLVLGAVALGSWLARPAYAPLFTGLSATDASGIVEQLRASGVPYELQGGGGTILVPEEHVYDQRLKAAAAGLPTAGGSGYSLLDQLGVTASEFQQSVTYKRALEGELAATIGAMEGVSAASVRLALPAETVFVAEKVDPTASVFVETAAGRTLSNSQVQAIAHLTSAAVEGMPVENVAVIDSRGTVLSAVGTGTAGTADQRANDYEERVRSAVQSMLDSVVGPGSSTVVVAAELSLAQGHRVEERYEVPEGQPAINESTTVEQFAGREGAGTAAGVLGPDNIAVPDATGDGAYRSDSTTRNNAVDRVTETVTSPAGTLVRQSVSVAIDAAAADGITLADVRALVATAAGIEPQRGDAVTVEIVPFSTVAAEQAQAALEQARDAEAADRLNAMVGVAMTVAAITLPLVLGAIVVMRMRRRSAEQAELAALQAATSPLAVGDFTATPLPPTVPLDEPVDDEAVPEVIGSARRRADIAALANRDPDRTAEFLRGLMDDRVGS